MKRARERERARGLKRGNEREKGKGIGGWETERAKATRNIAITKILTFFN